MDDRPWLHNPFTSIHAAALTNLGELTSGILVVSYFGRGQPAGEVRTRRTGIVTRLGTVFMKKARGTVTCTCTIPAYPTEAGVHDLVVEAVHTDSKGVVVAKTEAVWNVKIEPITAKNGGGEQKQQ